MAIIRLSDSPQVTVTLGSPAILRWSDTTGYIELEVGPLGAADDVVRDLDSFWSGEWRDWNYGFSCAEYVVTLELERERGQTTLRVDWHHMRSHVGVDRSAVVVRRQGA